MKKKGTPLSAMPLKRKISRRSLFGGGFVVRECRDSRHDGHGGGDDEFFMLRRDGSAYWAGERKQAHPSRALFRELQYPSYHSAPRA